MLRFTSAVVMALAIAFVPESAAAAFKFRLPWQSKAKVQQKRIAKAQPEKLARVDRDVQRLESILAGVKTSAKISEKSWKSVADEATVLADRIYVNVKSATTEKRALRSASDLRTHVRRMKKEAYQGDHRSTRRHAARALNVATRLDEWAG